MIFTDDGTRLTIWVRAELNAGLVAAAIPPLKSLFENVLRNVFGIASQLGRSTATGYPTKNTGTRRSRTRDLEDDEIAMRSHASHVYSGNHSAGGGGVYGSRSEDEGGESDKFEDVHGVTKTVSYTVRREQSYDSSRGNVKNGLP
jgi:hypothetical protein